MRVLTNKQDALQHINSLYPIGQTKEWDWIENL